VNSIPKELKGYPQWVAWRYEERDRKRTKVPYNAKSGQRASSTDPNTWSTFGAAAAVVAKYAGLGFVLTAKDPFVGIDLDHCRNAETGAVEPWAQQIIDNVASYTEVTPSKTGIRIFVRGSLPPGGRKRGNVEMYSTARYLTVTGDHLLGTPTTVEERTAEIAALHTRIFPNSNPSTSGRRPVIPVDLADAELIERAHRTAKGKKFARLWAGRIEEASHSEADLALCRMLAFWTGRDPARMDWLFRSSGLFRPKWDERHAANGSTYGQLTIAKAIATCTKVYTPRIIKVVVA